MRDSRHTYTCIFFFSNGRLLEGHHSNAVVIAERTYHLYLYLFLFFKNKNINLFI